MQSGKCPKCGSTNLAPRTNTRMLTVKRITCHERLFVELYAATPEEADSTRQMVTLIYLVIFAIIAAASVLPWLLF
jgi:predicted nucleic-acid-binding Zn-ribbon protein